MVTKQTKDLTNEAVKKLKETLATTSNETLKKYYNDLKLNIIPQTLSQYLKYLSIHDIIKYLEDEMEIRGLIKKARKIDIH